MDIRKIHADFMKRHKKDFELNEGLIKTAPISQAYNIIKHANYKLHADNKNQNITIFFDKIEKENIVECNVLMNNLGWFPAYITAFRNQKGGENKIYAEPYKDSILDIVTTEDFVNCKILYEAKFAIPFKVPRYLYHITLLNNFKKIKEKGLVPKSFAKFSSHPDRVYLSISKEACIGLLPQMKEDFLSKVQENNLDLNRYMDGKFCILQVNTEGLNRAYRFYIDPNYKKEGIFTLSTIPGYVITKIQEFE